MVHRHPSFFENSNYLAIVTAVAFMSFTKRQYNLYEWNLIKATNNLSKTIKLQY